MDVVEDRASAAVPCPDFSEDGLSGASASADVMLGNCNVTAATIAATPAASDFILNAYS